jgi:serine protease Do
MVSKLTLALVGSVLVALPAGAAEKLYHEHAGSASQATLPSLAPLVKAVKPAVVNINTSQHLRRGPMGGPGGEPFEQFFGQFFGGQPPQRELERQSLGSGFIVHERGFVLTNNHVIEGAEKIRITMADGREFAAKLVGTDPKTDVALLKIESSASDFPYVNLGDSDALEVGDWVVAIGNPFGLGLSVTHGLVSAKERSIGAGPYDDYIQSDALINPGNSGGPLFDLAGNVMGINTAMSRGQGIGFAVPINLAKQLLPQLETGKIVRGWLGVSVQSLTPDLARSLNLSSNKGALVAQVVKGGPAEKAGLKSGDVVVKLNNQPVTTANELTRAVGAFAPGSKIGLETIRDGQPKSFKLKVGQRPEDDQLMAEARSEEQGGPASEPDALGIAVQPLRGEQAQAMGLGSGEGVVVASVRNDGPAAQAGVEPGDVVLEVNRHKVHSVSEYQQAVGKVRTGEMALLRLQRQQSSIYVAVRI